MFFHRRNVPLNLTCYFNFINYSYYSGNKPLNYCLEKIFVRIELDKCHRREAGWMGVISELPARTQHDEEQTLSILINRCNYL